jgi:hypothetical protein
MFFNFFVNYHGILFQYQTILVKMSSILHGMHEIQQIYNKFYKSFLQNLVKLYRTFTELNKKIEISKKFNEISQKLTKFDDSKQYIHLS